MISKITINCFCGEDYEGEKCPECTSDISMAKSITKEAVMTVNEWNLNKNL